MQPDKKKPGLVNYREVLLTAVFLLLPVTAGCSDFLGSEPVPTALPDDAQMTYPTATTPVSTPIVVIPPRAPSASSVQPYVSVELVGASDETVGLQHPGYIQVEVVGRGLESVANLFGRQEANGHRLLLGYELLEPLAVAGEKPDRWQDGVHELVQVWDTEGTYLSDGIGGDFVLLRPYDLDGGLGVVSGYFRSAQESDFVESQLLFDTTTGHLIEARGLSEDDPVAPQPGDDFQVINFYIKEDGTLDQESGVTLKFNESAQLELVGRPLPSGVYFQGLSAEGFDGLKDQAFAEHSVNNDKLLSDRRAFFDSGEGIQFLYPADWPEPVRNESTWSTEAPTDAVRLTITAHPIAAGVTAEELKAAALEQFGNVHLLYEDSVAVDGRASPRTAYGYDTSNGPRTGVFFVTINDDLGYVVDVDGRADDEPAVLDLSSTLSDGWQFRRVLAGSDEGAWATIDWNSLSVSVPTDYRRAELESGWLRLTAEDANTFVALRVQEQGSDDPLETLRYWTEVAGSDLTTFESSEPYAFSVSDRTWTRRDFAYTNDDGLEVWGMILATIIGRQQVVVWAEAPVSDYEEVERGVFLTIIADLRESNLTLLSFPLRISGFLDSSRPRFA